MSSSFTTSICRIAPMNCTHRVKILGHSLTKNLSSNEAMECATFSLGGYQWAILYKPNHYCYNNRAYYTSFLLKLLNGAERVAVFMRFSLVDETGAASPVDTRSGTFTYTGKGQVNGFDNFKARDDLDRSAYVKDGDLRIECNLHIIKPSTEHIVPLPPSDLQQHFGNLLQSGDGSDISFKVKDEIFPAHRSILAARSSVFRAELFGPMKESKDACIEIQDMEAGVFKALLYFIYTDEFCPGDHRGNADQGADEEAMAQHLTAASDRYDLRRLKLICEDKLAERICEQNVMTLLMMAERHNCRNLEKRCLDYLSSAENLRSLIRTDGFARLTLSRPSIYEELLKKIATGINN